MPAEPESDFPPIVLTFAASDPSGGAGIQADILTLASMACGKADKSGETFNGHRGVVAYVSSDGFLHGIITG